MRFVLGLIPLLSSRPSAPRESQDPWTPEIVMSEAHDCPSLILISTGVRGSRIGSLRFAVRDDSGELNPSTSDSIVNQACGIARVFCEGAGYACLADVPRIKARGAERRAAHLRCSRLEQSAGARTDPGMRVLW
jgi:hypothetical protein